MRVGRRSRHLQVDPIEPFALSEREPRCSDCDENRTRLQSPSLGRRELLTYAAAFGTAFLARQGLLASESAGRGQAEPLRGPTDRRPRTMKKSINLWAFPYPGPMVAQGMPRTGQRRRLRRGGTELGPRGRVLGRVDRPARSRRSASWPTRSASRSAASVRSFSGRIR